MESPIEAKLLKRKAKNTQLKRMIWDLRRPRNARGAKKFHKLHWTWSNPKSSEVFELVSLLFWLWLNKDFFFVICGPKL